VATTPFFALLTIFPLLRFW